MIPSRRFSVLSCVVGVGLVVTLSGCGRTRGEVAVTTAPAKTAEERAANGPMNLDLATVNAPMEKAAEAERAQRERDAARVAEQTH